MSRLPVYAAAAGRTQHEARMDRPAKAAADARRVMGRRRWQRKIIACIGPGWSRNSAEHQ